MSRPLPIVKNPAVDFLAFVLPWGVGVSNEEYQQKVAPLARRIATEIDNHTCERAFTKSNRYRENFRIPFGDKRNALMQIGAVRPDNQNGGIRIVVNPAQFADGDAQHLHTVMERIVGRTYRQLLSTPLLNRIDFAVDVLHVDLDRLLVDYNYAQNVTMFGKRITRGGRTEGFNFGSVNSDYMCAVYDKRIERVHAAALNLIKNGRGDDRLIDNAIKRLQSTREIPNAMRVEVRGKKMRGLEPWKLDRLANRFARFRFADLSQNGTQLSELDEAAFYALCQQQGVKAALALFKGSPQASKVRKYWESRQASWWQPESLWTEACAALLKTGIFPDQAFAKPKVRNLAEPQL